MWSVLLGEPVSSSNWIWCQEAAPDHDDNRGWQGLTWHTSILNGCRLHNYPTSIINAMILYSCLSLKLALVTNVDQQLYLMGALWCFSSTWIFVKITWFLMCALPQQQYFAVHCNSSTCCKYTEHQNPNWHTISELHSIAWYVAAVGAHRSQQQIGERKLFPKRCTSETVCNEICLS